MKQWEFILLHIIVFLNLILIIMVPISYFALVPAYIQYRVELLGTPGNEVYIHQMAIHEMNATSINFQGDFRVAALAPFPVKAGMKAFTVKLMSDSMELAQLEMPASEFWVNDIVTLSVKGTFHLTDENRKNTQDLITRFSSKEGLSNLSIDAQFAPPITTFGIPVYSALSLHRKIDIGEVQGSVKSLLSIVNRPGPAAAIEFVGPTGTPGAALRANFNVEDIMQLPDMFGKFELIWESLTFKIDDTSMTVGFSAAFENPTPLELLPVDSIDYYVEIENTKVVKMNLRKVGLTAGLNNAFDIEMGFTFVDSKINAHSVQAAIELVSSNFANSKNANFAIVGPITVSKATFVQEISKDLRISVTLQDILAFVPSSILDNLKNPGQLINDENIKAVTSILGESKISLEVLSKTIGAKLGLKLPSLAFIKPPKAISFPYETSISIYGGQTKAIQIDADTISAVRAAKGLLINAGGKVTPVNTEAASVGLAGALNPVLARIPSPSKIGIKDFGFRTPGKPLFKWCSDVFGERVIDFGIPPIDKEALIAFAFSKPATDFISSIKSDLVALIKFGQVDIAQLNDRSGFGARGHIDVQYPPNFPELRIDIGYLHIDSTVEDVKLVGLELPVGLKFFPQDKGTEINGAAILARNDQFADKVQKLANALLFESELPSYAGVEGFAFGASQSDHYITFEKIVIEISTNTIINVVEKIAPNSSDLVSLALSYIPNGLVKFNGADFSIDSSTAISLQVQSTVNNPFPITFSIGTLTLDTYLGVDGQTLASITVSAITIGLGSSPLNLDVGLGLSTGANGMAQNIASVVNAVLNHDTSLSLPVGVTNMKLTPVNRANDDAIIDQLASLRIGFSVGKIIGFASNLLSSGGSGPIDISAIIPGGSLSDILTSVNPQIKFVQALARADAILNTSVDVDYSNPFPLSAKLPYLGVSTSLDGISMLDLDITGIYLSRQSGIY
jgi:hypothetical protein